MLAWPAIFGVIAIIAVQLQFGLPPNKESDLGGSGSAYSMGYHTGAICAAVLLALLLTWIVYRLSGRSHIASHITFSVVILFFCFRFFSQHVTHKPHPPPLHMP